MQPPLEPVAADAQSAFAPAPTPAACLRPNAAALNHDASLWAAVSLMASWRRCRTHGMPARPLLRATPSQGGAIRIEAQCPRCGRFLGFVQQRLKCNKRSPLSTWLGPVDLREAP